MLGELNGHGGLIKCALWIYNWADFCFGLHATVTYCARIKVFLYVKCRFAVTWSILNFPASLLSS